MNSATPTYGDVRSTILLHALFVDLIHKSQHARQALHLQVDVANGRRPDASWRRLPGRPRKSWSSRIRVDVGHRPLYNRR